MNIQSDSASTSPGIVNIDGRAGVVPVGVNADNPVNIGGVFGAVEHWRVFKLRLHPDSVSSDKLRNLYNIQADLPAAIHGNACAEVVSDLGGEGVAVVVSHGPGSVMPQIPKWAWMDALTADILVMNGRVVKDRLNVVRRADLAERLSSPAGGEETTVVNETIPDHQQEPDAAQNPPVRALRLVRPCADCGAQPAPVQSDHCWWCGKQNN